MRLANLDGRAVLPADATALDAALAGRGRFGPGLPARCGEQDAFRQWAPGQDLSRASLPTGRAQPGFPAPARLLRPRPDLAMGNGNAGYGVPAVTGSGNPRRLPGRPARAPPPGTVCSPPSRRTTRPRPAARGARHGPDRKEHHDPDERH